MAVCLALRARRGAQFFQVHFDLEARSGAHSPAFAGSVALSFSKLAMLAKRNWRTKGIEPRTLAGATAPRRGSAALAEAAREARLPRAMRNGAPERIRTSDPQIRSLVLYPAELRARLEGANLFRPPRKGKNYWRGWRTGRGGGGGGAAFSAKSFENSRIPPERWPLLPCPAPLRWLRLVGKGSGPS